MQTGVFADQTDLDMSGTGLVDPVYHFLPLRQVRFRDGKPQFPADNPGETGFLQHQRCLIKIGQGDVFDDTIGLDIAEEGDLAED